MPMTFAVVQQRESEREVAGIYAIPLAIDVRSMERSTSRARYVGCRWRQQKMRSPFHDRQGSTRRGNFPQRLLGLQPPTIGQDLHTGELG
jgi:hypothetical protein